MAKQHKILCEKRVQNGKRSRIEAIGGRNSATVGVPTIDADAAVWPVEPQCNSSVGPLLHPLPVVICVITNH